MNINLSSSTAAEKVEAVLKTVHPGYTNQRVISAWAAIMLPKELEARLDVLGMPKNARCGARAEYIRYVPLFLESETGVASRLTVKRGSADWFLIGVERTRHDENHKRNPFRIWITPEQEQKAREMAKRKLGIRTCDFSVQDTG